jgi:hypothetical protein
MCAWLRILGCGGETNTVEIGRKANQPMLAQTGPGMTRLWGAAAESWQVSFDSALVPVARICP